jgi:transcriptional regulator with XRE-family HTH domain
VSFADQLKSERKRLGLTQAGAEALLGLGKGQITAWETGRNTPHRWMQDGALRDLRTTKKRPK